MSCSPLDEAELLMVLLLREKPVLLLAPTKTKLILGTARSETPKAHLIPIEPALLYPVSVGAGEPR